MVSHFSDILVPSDICTPLNTDDVILAFSSSLFYFLSGTHVFSSHAVIDSLRSLHAFQDLTYPWPLILFSSFHKGQLILAAGPRAPDPWSNLNFATSQWGLFTEHVVRVQRVNVVEVAFEAQSVCFVTTSFYTTTLSSVPFSCSLWTVSLLLPILGIHILLYSFRSRSTHVHVHMSRFSCIYSILLGLELLILLKRLQ